jgi:hypothetical protein
MHGVRRELIEAQASAAGLRLVEVSIPAGCSNDVYEARFAAALDAENPETVAFADLFLETSATTAKHDSSVSATARSSRSVPTVTQLTSHP